MAGKVADPIRPEFSSTTMRRSDPEPGLEGKGWSFESPSDGRTGGSAKGGSERVRAYHPKVGLPCAKSLFPERHSKQSQDDAKMNLNLKLAPKLLIFGENILKMKL